MAREKLLYGVDYNTPKEAPKMSENEAKKVKKLTTAQRITQNKPIEIWQTRDGSWTWYVYRKWQKDDDKPYARWQCGVISPYTYGEQEYGDVYVSEIKEYARRTFAEDSE